MALSPHNARSLLSAAPTFHNACIDPAISLVHSDPINFSPNNVINSMCGSIPEALHHH